MTLSNIARGVQRVLDRVLGRDFSADVDIECRTRWFGSDYGGWDVAVDLLDEHSTVYSFGVGEDASFDVELIRAFGLEVHAFDPTPRSIEWVESQSLPVNFVFYEFGVADLDGHVSFNPPENPDHVSHTVLERPATESRAVRVPVKRLATIVGELGHGTIDLLKMDIEGAEYAVIDDLEQSGIRPRQLLVEFHHRFPNVGREKTEEAISKLKAMGYGLCAVSPTGEEFCFVYEGD